MNSAYVRRGHQSCLEQEPGAEWDHTRRANDGARRRANCGESHQESDDECSPLHSSSSSERRMKRSKKDIQKKNGRQYLEGEGQEGQGEGCPSTGRTAERDQTIAQKARGETGKALVLNAHAQTAVVDKTLPASKAAVATAMILSVPAIVLVPVKFHIDAAQRATRVARPDF